MAEVGIPIDSIARFFETNPRAIKLTLEVLDISSDYFANQDANEAFLSKAFEWRDMTLAKDIAYGKAEAEALASLGLFQMPQNSTVAKSVAEKMYGKEHDDDLYQALFDGKSAKDFAIETGAPLTLVRKQIKERGLDVDEIAKRGKQYRQIMKNAKVWELFCCDFNNMEISRITGVNDYTVAKICKEAKALGISEGFSREVVEDALLKGANLQDVSEAFGVSEYIACQIRRELVTERGRYSLDYKTESRRARIFEMYNREKMTQQEIADELGLSRTTVVTDIQKYEQDHPDLVDRTILWQQRNVSSEARSAKAERKQAIHEMINQGKSIGNIQKSLKISQETINRYCKEDGVSSAYQKKISETRSKKQTVILNSLRLGAHAEDIANINGWTKESVLKEIRSLQKAFSKELERAEEMRLAYQYPPYISHGPTTMIMGTLGRTRQSVLNDQHKTSNYLRRNAEVLALVKENNGDIKKWLPENEFGELCQVPTEERAYGFSHREDLER